MIHVGPEGGRCNFCSAKIDLSTRGRECPSAPPDPFLESLGEFKEADPEPVPDAMANAYNALAWIHHIASVHYMGGAFEPEHMRGIANFALEALGGEKPIPDFDASMKRARESARETMQGLGLDFDDEGGLVDTTDERRPDELR